MEPICPVLIDDVLYKILLLVSQQIVGRVRLTSKRALVPERLFSSLGVLKPLRWIFRVHTPRTLLSVVRKVDKLELTASAFEDAVSVLKIQAREVELADAIYLSPSGWSKLWDSCGNPTKLVIQSARATFFWSAFQQRVWANLEDLSVFFEDLRSAVSFFPIELNVVPKLKRLKVGCLCYCPPWIDCEFLNSLESWTIRHCTGCRSAWQCLDLSRMHPDTLGSTVFHHPDFTEQQKKQLSLAALQVWQDHQLGNILDGLWVTDPSSDPNEALAWVQSKCAFDLRPTDLFRVYVFCEHAE